MIFQRVVVVEVDVVNSVVDGRRTKNRLGARARAKLLRRASPQATGVAEAVLVGDPLNAVEAWEVWVAVGLV